MMIKYVILLLYASFFTAFYVAKDSEQNSSIWTSKTFEEIIHVGMYCLTVFAGFHIFSLKLQLQLLSFTKEQVKCKHLVPQLELTQESLVELLYTV